MGQADMTIGRWHTPHAGTTRQGNTNRLAVDVYRAPRLKGDDSGRPVAGSSSRFSFGPPPVFTCRGFFIFKEKMND
jgi:hypothetical protein